MFTAKPAIAVYTRPSALYYFENEINVGPVWTLRKQEVNDISFSPYFGKTEILFDLKYER